MMKNFQKGSCVSSLFACVSCETMSSTLSLVSFRSFNIFSVETSRRRYFGYVKFSFPDIFCMHAIFQGNSFRCTDYVKQIEHM